MSRIKRVLIGSVAVGVGLLVAGVGVYYATFYYAERATGTLVSSGQEREYLLYVPATYDPAKPTALVISLHGAMLWPASQRALTGWDAVADENGFIVVYPSGRAPWDGGTGVWPKVWHLSATAPVLRDVAFIRDLIDHLEATHNIDPNRIFVDGFSNGAAMAFALSCKLSDRVAAVGAVAAAQSLPWAWCSDAPMPMIAFHGTDDTLAPYEGAAPSTIAPHPIPDVREWVGRWAERNRCGQAPAETRVADDVLRLDYAGCERDAAVVLYTVVNGGHTWPGGKPMPSLLGRTSDSINATREIWAFFDAHPRASEVAHPSQIESNLPK